MEVFEHFANDLWSHYAQGFLLLQLYHIIIKCNNLDLITLSNAIHMIDFIFGDVCSFPSSLISSRLHRTAINTHHLLSFT